MNEWTQLLYAPLVMLAGALLGSWLYWRGQTRTSPLPTLPKFKDKAVEEPAIKYPRPKP